jgi:hypothetical protein
LPSIKCLVESIDLIIHRRLFIKSPRISWLVFWEWWVFQRRVFRLWSVSRKVIAGLLLIERLVPCWLLVK